MPRKQWFLSVVLFTGSLCFLVYSKHFFSSDSFTESAISLPGIKAPQQNVVLLADAEYYPVLKEHFRKAEKKILGTIYLFKTAAYRDNEPADLMRELIAAQQRGVSVELVLDISSEDANSDDANIRAATALSKAGVKVSFDSSHVSTHAKAFVIDDRYCFIGSHNLTHSAMASNKELSVFVDSTDMAQKVTEFISQIPTYPLEAAAGGKENKAEKLEQETTGAKRAER
ncbi:MAG TPA: phospholipase D-like domain-containing protein [Acidobacteriota bacterium]|nr:phospholipase D-like domain-containing protein [Acidobacteriota bacterium]